MLNDIQCFRPAPDRIAIEEDEAFLTLLFVLYDEARRICVLIGLNGSVANAIAAASFPTQWRMLIRFYPRQSARFLIATQRISRYWPETAVACALVQFHSALSKSADALISFASSSPNFDQTTICSLAAAHKVTCAKGQILLQTLERQLGTRSLLKAMAPDRRLSELLEQVIKGESPGVTSAGSIEMPAWAERRHHRRVAVNCPAEILGKSEARAIIENVSVAGVGLRFLTMPPVVSVGEQLTLSLADSDTISGTVVWIADRRAAIKFAANNNRIDPRMKFCLAKMNVEDLIDPK